MDSMFGSARQRKIPRPIPRERKSIQSHRSAIDESFVLVAAIDFGTTFSGYAFSFQSRPGDISMNKNWGGAIGFESYKTPTCVLTNPDGSFCAFGHEAESKYGQFTESDTVKGYEIYRHFKMLLHKEKNISRQTVLKSEGGKKRCALDIFVMAIKYLKEHMLDVISRQVNSPPKADMIRWVLTVPAIWTDAAKQFMREAAQKAGCIKHINSTRLVIALEPEAASLFCRRIEIGEYIMKGELTELPFKLDTQYLVIDAGGGTIDITAHEVLVNDQVEELHIANGGAWGGTKVDQEFINIMKTMLGEEFMNFFTTKYPSQWLNIMTAFERGKKIIKKDGESKLVIQISWGLGAQYQDQTGTQLPEAINKYKDQGISFQNGSIVFTNKASISLFQPVVEKVQTHIQQLLKVPKLRGISYVVLVGGFGESHILQEALKEVLPHHISMIVPPEAQLAVIKGAVHFGHNISEIKSRIARRTYGTDAMHRFKEQLHDDRRRKTLSNNIDWCDDVFEVFVRKGDSIDTGHVIKTRKTAIYDGQDHMDIDIFSTDKSDLAKVEYVDAPYMERLGGIHVKMPEDKKEVKLQFFFGGTEIQVKATDMASGSTAKTTIDFLTE